MTFLAMTIDTEEQWNWSAGWPVRDHSVENVAHLPRFEQLCRKLGIKTTWFVNWAVMHDLSARRTMLEINEHEGTELGMHIHPWLSPPFDTRAYDCPRDSFLHNAPCEEVLAKLDGVYQEFLTHGLQPRTFRGGRYSSGGAIHEFLLQKGFVADCSVVPFTHWPDDGAPNYFDRDILPVRVGTNARGGGFWELPVSLGFTRSNFRTWADRFERIETSRLSQLRLIGILGKLGLVKRVWLNFEDTSAADMLAFVRVLRPLQLPCICFTVHSSSLCVNGNPYSATQAQVDRIWETATEVLSQIAAWPDLVSATVSEIAESWDRDLAVSQNPTAT